MFPKLVRGVLLSLWMRNTLMVDGLRYATRHILLELGFFTLWPETKG